MYGITRASRCRNNRLGIRLGVANVLSIVAFLCSALAASEAVAKPFKNEDVAKALTSTPLVPLGAEQVAKEFLDVTLPRLAASDPQAAARFGFGGKGSQKLVIEKIVTLQILDHPDIFKFVPGQTDPIDLVNNDNNWVQGDAPGIVVMPKRVMVLFSRQGATEASGSTYQLSVTLEYYSGSWRIIQAGAPRLSRAIHRFKTAKEQQFLIWIPDLNRHYLGYIPEKPDAARFVSVFFTALFNDPMANRTAGETFNATSKEFFDRLIKLYRDLNLGGRLSGQVPGVIPGP